MLEQELIKWLNVKIENTKDSQIRYKNGKHDAFKEVLEYLQSLAAPVKAEAEGEV